MDYMENGMLVEVQPEVKTEEKQLLEYLNRFKKEKEEAGNAE